MSEAAPIFGRDKYEARQEVRIAEADEALNNLERRMLDDTAYLPSRAEVESAFYSGDLSRDNNAFFDFIRRSDHRNESIREILTQEYIGMLAEYLQSRAQLYSSSPKQPVVILEAGAGNGRLSYFLDQALKMQQNKIKIIANDLHMYPNSPIMVEICDVSQALIKYEPKIVICSWMSYGRDLTALFRKTPSVSEYLLIGEPEGGSCGDDHETWGEDYDFENGVTIYTKPWEKDGFERVNLNELSAYQLSRNDNPTFQGHSATVSFRRK